MIFNKHYEILQTYILCFPITELKSKTNLIGRTAEIKEIAHFEITESNIKVFLEMLKMFGTLSDSHRH
ncbi:MAG: restriction endonuclease [Candidatus Moranbacteria bacterium CG_4_8_14_3_um_filter_34_16]|nr:MAG: restriction endonuclease [Candidatus Moranbacteria bacterium CG_4_8_14_3_um_filter_34_16]